MGEFKKGDTIYHKATDNKGVISGKSPNHNKWIVTWGHGGKGEYIEAELQTEQEHREGFEPA